MAAVNAPLLAASLPNELNTKLNELQQRWTASYLDNTKILNLQRALSKIEAYDEPSPVVLQNKSMSGCRSRSIRALDCMALLLRRQENDDVATGVRILPGPGGKPLYDFYWTRKGAIEPRADDGEYLNAIASHFSRDLDICSTLETVVHYCSAEVRRRLGSIALAAEYNIADGSTSPHQDILDLRDLPAYLDFEEQFQNLGLIKTDFPAWALVDNVIQSSARASTLPEQEICSLLHVCWAFMHLDLDLNDLGAPLEFVICIHKAAAFIQYLVEIRDSLPDSLLGVSFKHHYIPSPPSKPVRIEASTIDALNTLTNDNPTVKPIASFSDLQSVHNSASTCAPHHDGGKYRVHAAQHPGITLSTALSVAFANRQKHLHGAPQRINIGLSQPPCAYCALYMAFLSVPAPYHTRIAHRPSSHERSTDWLPYDLERIDVSKLWNAQFVTDANMAVISKMRGRAGEILKNVGEVVAARERVMMLGRAVRMEAATEAQVKRKAWFKKPRGASHLVMTAADVGTAGASPTNGESSSSSS